MSRADATLSFTFDGRAMTARPGETLAAALLANGVRVVGRSFKYHRPRGILSAGVEEPNALVTVAEGARATPNTRATDVFVYDGMVAQSQNRWPSLAFDTGAVIGLAGGVFSAGFYYKTFFGPPKRWMLYERFIRRAAGLGPAPQQADPDPYAQRAAFCDVLVVGGGEAGLTAAHEAAEAGARVILVENDAALGAGMVRDGRDPTALVEAARSAILAKGGRVLTRTSAAALGDSGSVTLLELKVEPGMAPPAGTPAQVLWKVRAGRVILATGAIERPLTFPNNDRPGVMLSRAVRDYIGRWGVRPGRRAVIATNNDDGYLTAQAILNAGGEVAAVLDSRPAAPDAVPLSCPVHLGASVVKGLGGKALLGVVARIEGRDVTLRCDLLAMSGGFTPTIHLHSQGGGKLVWREAIGAYAPGAIPGPNAAIVTSVGACAGDVPTAAAPQPAPGEGKKAVVDFQNDVTAADIALAWREGYRSVEHLKRYTTLGMATDQGKTSNLAAIGQLAAAGETTIPEAGLTTYRPPYAPLTLGALAGVHGGGHCAPRRRIALHDAHATLNPLWQPAGYWHRPAAYPRPGETLAEAGLREAMTVRRTAGLVDVSTLAKFAVTGPDAAALLERVCATRVANLKVGRGKYTFMLREDGMVVDDGTVWRIGDEEWLLTSSTGGTPRMERQLRYVHEVLAPHLRCAVVGQQEHFAGIALAGPQAKSILESLTGQPAPKHMGIADATLAGVPVRILAASYSGERAFEVYAEAPAARPVWEALHAAVIAAGGAPYGLEAMEYLRIEKGHVLVGGEVDGRTTPHDIALDGMLNPKGGYIGASALHRPALSAPGRLQLVGLISLDGKIAEGSMLIDAEGAPITGHVTSAGKRLDGSETFIAMALLTNGRARMGDTLIASSPTRGVTARVRVVTPHFHDPEGSRYRD